MERPRPLRCCRLDRVLVILLTAEVGAVAIQFDSSEFGLETGRYAQFDFPVQAWIITDDAYSPSKAVEALLARLVVHVEANDERETGFREL